MTDTDQPMQNPEQSRNAETEAYLKERMQWVGDAVAIITGESSSDPREVLPEPTEVRDDAEPLALSDDQEVKLREVAGRFGIGAENDVLGSAKVRVKEGGKAWKVEAEIAISADDETLILAGSPNRIIGQDEVEHIQKMHGVDSAGKSEFEMMRLLAGLQDGFVAQKDAVMPFGYDIDNDNSLVQGETGQLVKIGERNGESVMLLRIDRKDQVDEAGNPKHYQPDAAAIMTFIGDVLTACGDESSAVGIDTSSTYPSRAVNTIRAGLNSGRRFDVGMYGRQTLAEVRDLPVAEPTGINQIPGELRKVYDTLAALDADLDGSRTQDNEK